jgi:hypothetical protein
MEVVVAKERINWTAFLKIIRHICIELLGAHFEMDNPIQTSVTYWGKRVRIWMLDAVDGVSRM